MDRTLGGRGLVSLASFIALMLLVAESSNGAFDSHSSRLRAGFGWGVGMFRRGIFRAEAMALTLSLRSVQEGCRRARPYPVCLILLSQKRNCLWGTPKV